MAHANIVNNELVDDDRIPMRDLPFAARTASKFCEQIGQLAAARNQIPAGWQSIFDHALRSLRAVDCPKRDGIELSEIAFGRGSLNIEVYYAPVDKVVRGILNCLSKRTCCTCEVCGRGYGAVCRHSRYRTLCASCYVQTDLANELQRWLSDGGANSAYRNRPLIEVDSLPINIRLLIPEGRVRRLRLVSDDREITYVTPDTVTAHLKTLAAMKRCLDQSQGS
ncbi:hypothetical protein RCH06_003599 [Polaromonas sp. CG_9.5]|uniref:hypothetical protein n=1 Tax=Polaromonas sp. CG_9.5 TaxID=3071705 RepID=UPI002DFD9F20|nr:hypothetical protein [Polaromonas sp. CG_9.5]